MLWIAGCLVLILLWISVDYYEIRHENKILSSLLEKTNRELERQEYFANKYYKDLQAQERWLRDLQKDNKMLREQQKDFSEYQLRNAGL